MKKIILTIVLIICALLILLFVFGSRERSKYAKHLEYVEQIRYERDLLYQKYDDPKNGAHDYLAAFELFKETPNETIAQELRQIVKEGWKLPSPAAFEWMEGNRPALEKVRLGNTKPFRLMPRMERLDGPWPVSFSAARIITELFIAEGKQALADGDVSAAIDAYLDAIRFGYGIQSDKTTIGILAGSVLYDIGLAAFRDITPRIPDGDVLVDMLDELALLEQGLVPLSEAFKSELLVMANSVDSMYEQIGEKESLQRQAIEQSPSSLRWPYRWTHSKKNFLRGLFGKERVAGYLAGCYIELIEQSKLSYPQLAKIKSRSYDLPKNKALRLIYILDNPIGKVLAAISVPRYTRLYERWALLRTDERATKIMLSLQLFKLQMGEFPQGLAEVEHAVGTPLPEDPFSGQPFHYERREGGYILYSVGPDMTDDRGLVKCDKDNPSSGDLIYSFTHSDV